MFDKDLSLVEKEQGAATAKAFMDSFTSMTALGRLARCEEIEGLIQLLASEADGHV